MKNSAPAAATLLHFRRILTANNQVMEKIAKLEQALGGEFIFDRTFLGNSIDELNVLCRQIIYSLNILADQRYDRLYDRLTVISNHLADLINGGPGPYDQRLVLSYDLLHRDLDHVVGAKNAVIGEIRNQLHLTAPDGFAISVNGYQLFLQQNNLREKISTILKNDASCANKAEAIRKLIAAAPVPEELATAISRELKALQSRQPHLTTLAVRSSGVGEDGRRSFAGQFLSLLDVEAHSRAILQAYRELLLSRFATPALDYIGEALSVDDIPMAVGVQVMVPAATAGVLYTRDPADPAADRLVVSAVPGSGAKLVDGSTSPDRYIVDRRHPFSLLSSEIISRPEHDNDQAMGMMNNGLRRGSALLTPGQLRLLAENALLLEKAFNSPQDIEWAISDDGVTILQSRPLRLPTPVPPPAAEVLAELKQAKILMQGHGHIVQLGITSGPVVHVTQDTNPADFPVGGIAVAGRAGPRLSPIVRRAAAIITDIGSPTGHLATIAREYRTPALFGTEIAGATLPEGRAVTLDTENRIVYDGCIKNLITAEAARDDILHDSPELKILRRLLRWIAPLTLTDPQASLFKPEHCLTLHDIIRFTHEKAVAAIIELHGDTKELDVLPRHQLNLPIPIRLHVIDLDGGLLQDAGPEVTRQDITSRPFKPLIAGLLKQNAWDREPAPFGLRDIINSISRPVSQLVNPPAFTGNNLALVAADYCNLSLRLGYHFNVIDAYFSDEVEDNYIYFRFVGGFAEKHKRVRRAELIGMILAGLHFKIDQQGDLLIGKAKRLNEKEMETTLIRLGELIAFSRQLDVRMTGAESVEHYFTAFLEKCLFDLDGG